MTVAQVAFPLLLAIAIGCTPHGGDQQRWDQHGHSSIDSAAFSAWEDSMRAAFERNDTVSVDRATREMISSPYAHGSLTLYDDVLEMREWAVVATRGGPSWQQVTDSLYTAAEETDDTLVMFAVSVARSRLAMRMDRDLSASVLHMENALRLDPRRLLIDQVPELYGRMAEHYDNVKRYDKALEYSHAMINHGIRTGNGVMERNGHVFQACEHQLLGHADSVDTHLEAAKRLIAVPDSSNSRPSMLALLAGVERQRNKSAQAGPFLDSMLLDLERLHVDLAKCALCAKEKALFELHMGRPQQARIVAVAMRTLPAWNDSKFLQQCYHEVMEPLSLATGDHKSAYDSRLSYQALRDSMNLTTAAANLRSIENNYKAAAEEAQRSLVQEAAANQLQQERTRRNILLIAGAAALVFGAVSYRQRRRTQKALHRSDELLLNILPHEVAEELKAKGHADAKHFDQVTILFTDFKGFTEASEKLSPQELVEELNTCFKAFDGIITARGIEKIKTIGDAYMCAGGLPDPASSTPTDVVHAALEMQAFMVARKAERDRLGKPAFEMRVGIHTGPVVAGIVGVKKFAYDIWGDTVNIASRMESSGEVGQVNISEATYALVKDAEKVKGEWSIANGGSSHSPTPIDHSPAFTFAPRGKVHAKGKGEMEMYFVQPTSH